MKWFTVSRLGDHMEETPEGFLLIRDVAIARCGTQLYRHNEVPMLEADEAGWLRIDREPQEVFHTDTLASYEGKPLVNDHPDEPVTPANWTDLAIGHIANIRRGSNADHDLLFADILVTTDKGIRLIRAGKRAVSVGYDAAYEQQGRGRGRQTRIIANHLALVDEGRCGSRCTILDGAPRFVDAEEGPSGTPARPDTITPVPAPPKGSKVLVHGDLEALEYRAEADDTPLYRPRGWNDDLDYAQTLDVDWVEGEHPRDADGKFGKGAPATLGKPGQPPDAGSPLKTANWKKVGGQLGSNPGAQMLDETGKKHYVKFAKSEAHARNEHLAAKLYEAAGAPVLKTKLVDTGGKVGTATEWADRRDIDIKDADDRRQAQAHFATHAWLANWDAAGLTHDNQAEVDDKMTTLDPGGSLIFRAQGGPKGEAFGHEATEWDTLHHPVKGQFANQQAHELFGEMTPEQMRASAKKVAGVKTATIHDLVSKHGPGTVEQRKALAAKLVNRRNSIAKRAGLSTADRKWSWRDLIAVKHWVGGLTVSIGVSRGTRARDDSQGWQGQPRVPAGQEGGGQWSEGGGGGAGPALPEMKSKYFQKEAAKFGEAVQAAYQTGGKSAALQAAQALQAKWKHSVMQAHMAKAMTAIHAHEPQEYVPESPQAPTEAEIDAMAAAHGEALAQPDPLAGATEGQMEAMLSEPITGSQKSVHAIFSSPTLTTAEKLSKLKEKLPNYVDAGNKAYAEQAIAMLEGGMAQPGAPGEPSPAQPAAAATGGIPAPAPDSMAQETMFQNATASEVSLQKKLEWAKEDVATYKSPKNAPYAQAILAALEAQQAAAPAPEASGDLPTPPPGVSGWVVGVATNPNTSAKEKVEALEAELPYTVGAEKEYTQAVIKHFGGAPAPTGFEEPPPGAGLPEHDLPAPDPQSSGNLSLLAVAKQEHGSLSEKLKHINSEAKYLDTPLNHEYAEKLKTAVSGGLPPPNPDSALQMKLHKLVLENPTDTEQVEDLIATMPANGMAAEYGNKLIAAMKAKQTAPAPEPASGQSAAGYQKVMQGWANKLPPKEALKTLKALMEEDLSDADKALGKKLIAELEVKEPPPQPPASTGVAGQEMLQAAQTKPKAEAISDIENYVKWASGQTTKEYGAQLLAHLKGEPAPAPAGPPPKPTKPTTGSTWMTNTLEKYGEAGDVEQIKSIVKQYGGNYEEAATYGNQWLAHHGQPPQAPNPPPMSLSSPSGTSKAQAELYNLAKAQGAAAQTDLYYASKKGPQTTKAYAAKLLEQVKAHKEALNQHAAKWGPGGSAMQGQPATAPAAPKPPPQPQGPAPYAGSPGQEQVHKIATDPSLSSAQKLALIEAIKSDTAVAGPKTQEFANQWQQAIKTADPAGTASPAPSAAATPSAPAAPAAPKPSPNLAQSSNKKLHARYKALRDGALKVSSSSDPKAQTAAPTVDKAWWAANSTSTQRAAIQDYKDSSYGINGYLRDPKTGGSKYQKYAHDIDEVFESDDAVVQKDTLCMRGETVDSKVVEQWKADLAAGHHVRPQRTGFTSTALGSKVPSSFSGQNVIYEIVARKGTRALSFWAATQSHQSENEFVLRHGTALEIYEIEKVGSQHIVRCATV